MNTYNDGEARRNIAIAGPQKQWRHNLNSTAFHWHEFISVSLLSASGGQKWRRVKSLPRDRVNEGLVHSEVVLSTV
jgi:hypothetical protein